MAYFEAFVAPVPDDKREEYLAKSEAMAALRKEYGAEQVLECWGTHVPQGRLTSFPKAVMLAAGETVVFGLLRWPSKEAREAAFERMMADRRMKKIMADMPFDGNRLIFGGFESIVEM